MYSCWWDTETVYVLTRHSGVCRPGQTAPLEPSISPGDDPDNNTQTSGQTKSTHNPALDFFTSGLRGRFVCVQCWQISLLVERLICESSLGNKAQERLSERKSSQRNICIVKAIELINRVTDKGESLSLRAIKTLARKLSTADKATLVSISEQE